MPRLTIRNLDKAFSGRMAVENVSLDIEDGAFLALLGPSGCGKTTLLRMIAGLERPDRGEILFDNEIVAAPNVDLPPEKRNLGMVFQSYALWPNMTVRGNIEFGLKIAGLDRTEREKRISEVLDVVDLTGLDARRPHALSGGQRQRVALARSLAMRPRLILLDEPLANLDAHLREAMLVEFRRIHSVTGATFVFVTHDQDEAMAVATHVAVMNRGRLEQVGEPELLYRRPQTGMVARFIGKGRTLPVDVTGHEGEDCVIRLGSAQMKMPGTAPTGPGWLCFHASDLTAVPGGGHFRAELVSQIFQNGAFLSHFAPLGIDVETVSLHLKERMAAGTRVGVNIAGGWVIPRADADVATPRQIFAPGEVA